MIWPTIGISIVVFAIALTGMAIGVIISNRRIKGSCGGLANLRDSQGRPMCEGCSNPSPDCLGNPAHDSE
ncbi:MAG: (Na+)-NQR maturation NqrM [Planctomycetales bacterium]|nr:(Na+)-NQR maturation NqrM [Planctomycetales bacterium]